ADRRADHPATISTAVTPASAERDIDGAIREGECRPLALDGRREGVGRVRRRDRPIPELRATRVEVDGFKHVMDAAGGRSIPDHRDEEHRPRGCVDHRRPGNADRVDVPARKLTLWDGDAVVLGPEEVA